MQTNKQTNILSNACAQFSNHLETRVMSHHLETHESNILQNTTVKLTDSGQFANLVPFDQPQK